MATIEISPVSKCLHQHYPGQTGPQPCYIELDPVDRTLRADWDGEIGGAVPMSVWHDRVIRWKIAPLKQAAAETLLAKLAPLAERICDGYEEIWDGSNNVGRYSDDAREARDMIADKCDDISRDEDSCLRVWDAGDWYGDLRPAEVAKLSGISATSTDAEIAAAAERAEAQAADDGIDILEGAESYLQDIRDQLAED